MRLLLDIPCALPIWLSEYVWERVILYVYESHKQFLRKAFVFILENRIQCMSYTIAENNVISHKMEQKKKLVQPIWCFSSEPFSKYAYLSDLKKKTLTPCNFCLALNQLYVHVRVNRHTQIWFQLLFFLSFVHAR